MGEEYSILVWDSSPDVNLYHSAEQHAMSHLSMWGYGYVSPMLISIVAQFNMTDDNLVSIDGSLIDT